MRAADQGGALTEQEMLSTIFQLVVAGHDTTTSLIGNGTAALLLHPEQRDALAADPALVPHALEEILRWDAPVPHSTFRYTTQDVALGGTIIPAFAQVIISLGAANRDRARYDHPETLDITRADTSHLAFGHGIHHCLGARLARLEGAIALTTLHGRFPPCGWPSHGRRCAGATATGWSCEACPNCRSSSARRENRYGARGRLAGQGRQARRIRSCQARAMRSAVRGAGSARSSADR